MTIISKGYHPNFSKKHMSNPLMIQNKLFSPNIYSRLFSETSRVEKIGLYAASFDPLTNGHLNVIQKASKIFDKLIVCVAVNPAKTPLFSLSSRMEMLTESTKSIKNVSCVAYKGLIFEFAKEKKVDFLIRGARSTKDFEEESILQDANHELSGIDTMLFFCPRELKHINSSLVRANLHSDLVTRWVPPQVAKWQKDHGMINGKAVISLTYDNPKLKAAGVVPYAQGDDGKVYVLLGKQALYPHASAGQWKGFGGRRDEGETLIYTALREAKEESRGVLGVNSPCYNSENVSFDHVIVSEHYQSKYLQLMLPVTWDKDAPSRFQKLTFSDPYQMEKLAICWVAFENLYQTLKEAHDASIEEGCLPKQMNRIFSVDVASDKLILAKDFIETLLVNFRNPQDSIHLLAQNVMPIPSSLTKESDRE